MSYLRLTVDHRTYRERPLINEMGNERLWKIARMSPMTDGEFEACRQMSIYWYNIKHLQCEYNAAIHRRLKDLGLDE
jgi:hypothetical protein